VRTLIGMSSISTRWSVSADVPVAPDDVATDGRVTGAAVARWVAAARSTYLEQCTVLEAARAEGDLDLDFDVEVRPPAAQLHRSPSVVVSASATEVFPTSFVISVRIRPLGSEHDDRPINVSCAVRLRDPATGAVHPIDDAIRDELIALEHAARHFN
jgi:hypothetical protein